MNSRKTAEIRGFPNRGLTMNDSSHPTTGRALTWTTELVQKFWDYQSNFPHAYFTKQFGSQIARAIQKFAPPPCIPIRRYSITPVEPALLRGICWMPGCRWQRAIFLQSLCWLLKTNMELGKILKGPSRLTNYRHLDCCSMPSFWLNLWNTSTTTSCVKSLIT
jgi:hypothetical protein